MTYSLEWIKEQGEAIGDSLFEKLKRDHQLEGLTYTDFVLLMDFMYAQMFDRVYADTYRKNRSTKDWTLGENKE